MGGASPPHTPLAGAGPQTPRFCSDIEGLTILKTNQNTIKILFR